MRHWYKPSERLPKNGEKVIVEEVRHPYLRDAVYVDNGTDKYFLVNNNPCLPDSIREWAYFDET